MPISATVGKRSTGVCRNSVPNASTQQVSLMMARGKDPHSSGVGRRNRGHAMSLVNSLHCPNPRGQ